MSSSNSIAVIYNLLVDIEGPILARETVTSVLFSVITDLKNEGLSVTSEILDERLHIEACKFIKASKKDVA